MLCARRSKSSTRIIFELMETDLYRVIHSTQVLTEDHAKFFIYQVLKALDFMHANGIVHRDVVLLFVSFK